jgi:hypothetical protein
MSLLDPKKLFRRLADDLPKALHKHVFIVGSLAAAYHFRSALEGRAVNTKDADVVVYPAGNVRAAKELAVELLDLGWRRTPICFPLKHRSPADRLRALRLFPPRSQDYFVELLGLPAPGQSKPVVWVPIKLPDGWYGVGCFRFMRLTSIGRLKSSEGLSYASPSMMALANLLSHPKIGKQPIGDTKIRRSAKDLGRVLALAWLSGRDGTEAWLRDWQPAIRHCFPKRWRQLSKGTGSGLQELLDTPAALEEARITADIGLLNGRGVSAENLRAVGRQLVEDVLRPFSTS